MRRSHSLAAILFLVVAGTASCSDRTSDGFAVVNDSRSVVTVVLVGRLEMTVRAGHRKVVETDNCLGTGIVVKVEGNPDVDIPGAACTGSVLYVREDYSAYVESLYG